MLCIIISHLPSSYVFLFLDTIFRDFVQILVSKYPKYTSSFRNILIRFPPDTISVFDWQSTKINFVESQQVSRVVMADLGTPAAGAMTPNPAAPAGGGKQPLVYICGGVWAHAVSPSSDSPS